MNAIYPGSFDPVTLGHADLIRRAAAICDILTVAILVNPEKSGTFPLKKRLDMVKSACEGLDNVRVLSYQGLLVDLARELGVSPLTILQDRDGSEILTAYTKGEVRA